MNDSEKNKLLSAGALAAAGVFGYATYVEPYAIHHERVTVTCDRLPTQFDGYRVLLMSDFHSRNYGFREKRVMKIVKHLPEHDLIALCGDLIYTSRGMDDMAQFVSELHARDGVFVTYGNSEHKNGIVPHLFSQRLEQSGAQMLLNRHVQIDRGGASIILAGVDDPVSGCDDINKTFAGVDQDKFQLLLMHTPDSVALACARGVDLVLSGHTHGGQVKLPIVGAAFTHSFLGSAMSHGLYKKRRLENVLGFRPGRTQLYVSRGIGISGLAMRFLCRPEITTLTLKRSPLADLA